MFPADLESNAFRDPGGEFGWTRDQITRVVPILIEQNLAILGGELWWVQDGASTWNGLIPQVIGPDAVYAWETKRTPDEPWASFVKRCSFDTLATVEKLPRPGEIPENLPGRILYNLTWVSEKEYDELCHGSARQAGEG